MTVVLQEITLFHRREPVDEMESLPSINTFCLLTENNVARQSVGNGKCECRAGCRQRHYLPACKTFFVHRMVDEK